MDVRGSAWLAQLRHLLPTGPAWSRDLGTTRDKLLGVVAREFARIEADAESVLDAADPQTAVAMLPEWEADYGLPDGCTVLLETIAERRDALLAKIFAEAGGDMSPQFYIDLAAVLGVAIAIVEGIEGDGSTWIVTLTDPGDEIYFTAGSAVAGQALVTVSATVVECFLQKYAPAHTAVIFT